MKNFAYGARGIFPILLCSSVLMEPAFGLTPPNNKVCTSELRGGKPTMVVAPEKLASWFLDQHRYRLSSVDLNGDETITLEEKIRAVSDVNFCEGTRCDDEDKGALRSAGRELIDFLKHPGPDYHVLEARTPTQADIDRRLWLKTPVGKAAVRAEDGRAYTEILCVSAIKTEEQPSPPDKTKRFWDDIVVAGKIDDLAISRGDRRDGGALARALAPISSATASFAFDRVSDINTFTFDAAVGYGINWTVDDDRLGLMPFVYYKRIDLSGPGSEEGKGDVDQLSTGVSLIYSAYFDTVPFLGTSLFTLSPMYTTDSEADTKIGTFKALWSPTFQFFRQVQRPFDGPIYYRLSASAMASGGRVFDDGGNEALSEEKNFARAGGAISGELWQKGLLSILDDVKFTGSYVYMPTVSGHQRDLERIELGAEYVFPQLKNFSIKLNYEKGRTDETLELVDLVTLGFGFKW